MTMRALCAVFLLVATVGPLSADELKPGLIYVFFDDTAFQRPGSHGAESGVRNHGTITRIESHGVEDQVDLDITGIQGFSRLWTGQIRFPADAEVTFTVETDHGLRLYVDDKVVIDGWAKDGSREGKLVAKAGQTLPLRLEYYHEGAGAFLRLFWQWPAHARQLVPASALLHSDKDWQTAVAITEGRESTAAAGSPGVLSVPTGSDPDMSSIYRPGVVTRPEGPIRLSPGPQLFLDEYLIDSSQGLSRRVNSPQRDPKIPNPLITGKDDECVGPYLTVIRDPQDGRFRIWYNVYKEKLKDGSAWLAHLESPDGIHWKRPRQVIKSPAAVNFGSAVIDEGPQTADPAGRYKAAWWADGGLMIAVSADGLDWSMLRPYPVLRHNHDINNIFRDPVRNRYQATISVYIEGPRWTGQRRSTMITTSPDLLNWEKPWYVLTPDDQSDPGQTQFYAMSGYIFRGDLIVALVKVLHDDWRAPGAPEGAFGVGFTTLAWSRDGRHWVRDQEPYFEPDADETAWDHAHAWMDYQLPLGDEVYIYYGGYKYGHKMDRWEGRQIGLVKIQRDRYVARQAGADGGSLVTPPVVLVGNRLTVNANIRGELRMGLISAEGNPLPGFSADDCRPVQGDSLSHTVLWKSPLADLGDKPVRMEFHLRDGELYGFDLMAE